MGFLDNYLTVNQKVKMAHERFPNCRIITNIIEHDLASGWALVMADFYREASDTEPSFRDFAYGHVNFYPNNMKRWFIEDTTSSAIGRCLATALALGEKPNRETMEQIERTKAKDINADDQGAWGLAVSKQESMATAATAIADLESQLGAELTGESPICKHGHMIFKSGEKNGKEWGGWFCPMKNKADQCAAQWAVRSASTGNWRMK